MSSARNRNETLRWHAIETNGEAQLIRVDSDSVEETFGQIDWTKSSATQLADDGQDLNFNGSIESLNPGFNDWKNMRLNQVGSRRNVGAWFWVYDPDTENYGAFIGPLSVDVGRLIWASPTWVFPTWEAAICCWGTLAEAI